MKKYGRQNFSGNFVERGKVSRRTSRGNAVVYGENIREGLLTAIRMDDREYDRMTGALAALADEISAQSLNDLKDAFAPTEHTLRPRKTE